MATPRSKTRILTKKIRLSYLNAFVPKAREEGGPLKYSASIIIDQDDKETLKRVAAAIRAATAQGKKELWKGKIPKNLKQPLRDGDIDREDDAAYEGKMFLNANSRNAPGLIDREREEIIDPKELYSGCYARVSLNFYPFAVNGNNGIAVGLENIQFLADGPKLSGGGVNAADDFDEDLPDEEDFDDMM